MMIHLFLLTAVAPQEDLKEYWYFEPGTEWTYEDGEGEAKKKSVLKVGWHSGGRIFINSTDWKAGNKEIEKEEILVGYCDEEKKVVVWAKWEGDKGQEKAVHPFYPFSSHSKWNSPMGESEVTIEIARSDKTEKVKAAGKEWDAYKCTFAFGEGEEAGTGEYWFAKGVGLLRMILKRGDAVVYRSELTSFKPK